MSKLVKRWASSVVGLAVGVAVLIPIGACQDHDPLAPIPSRLGIPKVNKTLSVGGGSAIDINAAGEVLGYIFGADGTRITLSGRPLEPADSAEIFQHQSRRGDQ